ncbi:hypothetical protein QAD02_005545 [Eretmocerus hayati]|uniref:Uncharacterized protein n=1 Tax=Eretmocerus hayati TaxID=131215 RepID=A0ACC2NTU3_9HYME|nr:hypothetical protein QAD02_005545 [Eretmocerus hayati]
MLLIVALSLVTLPPTSLSNEIKQELNWWMNSVIYQIYPRSFKDSNGDGVGDLPGLISQLNHVHDIGADAMWLSPIYPSPAEDSGYDITNFTDIDPLFGTLADFDALIAKAKELGVKVLMDFVPNHTSTKHPWFLKSVDRIEPYDNYFIWRDAKKGPNGERRPPNNWLSVFGNSAWEWNEKRQQYYYHVFAIGQADLNFHNPQVEQKIKDVLRFWMNRGVDGFRSDAIDLLYEKQHFLDEPLSGKNRSSWEFEYLSHPHTANQNENYHAVSTWRKTMDEFVQEHGTSGKPLIIESHSSLTQTMKFYEFGGIPFNFMFLILLNGNSTASDFKNNITTWLDALPRGQKNNSLWVIGNHDKQRVASRFGENGNRADQITMLAMILPGTVVVYNGDEIGMVDWPLTYEQTLDPLGCYAGRENFMKTSRDPARTPFQWDDTTSAGFSSNSITWLPVHENYKHLNLASQKRANKSHYKVFKALSSLKKSPVLEKGSLQLELITENVLAVVRRLQGEKTVVLLINFSDENVQIDAKAILNIPDVMQVYIASVGSGMDVGLAINTNEIELPGAASVILV